MCVTILSKYQFTHSDGIVSSEAISLHFRQNVSNYVIWSVECKAHVYVRCSWNHFQSGNSIIYSDTLRIKSGKLEWNIMCVILSVWLAKSLKHILVHLRSNSTHSSFHLIQDDIQSRQRHRKTIRFSTNSSCNVDVLCVCDGTEELEEPDLKWRRRLNASYQRRTKKGIKTECEHTNI